MVYVEIGGDGRAIRWSTTPFDAASATAPMDTDFSHVYFKAGQIHDLPPAPADFLSWDVAAEEWVDLRSAEQIAADLADFRSAGYRQVLDAIAAARAMFITDIPGQQMIYLAKETEAHAWLVDGDPVISNYPLIAAEVGITAATQEDLVALWLAMAAQWRAVAAQLEGLRMTAQQQIAAATDTAGIEAAVAALVQALAGE